MSGGPITVLLEATRAGDETATDRLFAAVYGELKKLAHSHRRRWRGNDTLNTTALIHEAFIKLSGPDEQPSFANRTHFYATASKAMRQILVNYAERQSTAKRGGDAVRVPLDDIHFVTETTAEELLDLDRLLGELESDNPRRCRIVECRVFGGMSVEETAQALGISPATVKRDWQISSAWLYQAMSGELPQQ
jgi:RNA polymerase sigma factor (TIGR02999 family)